MKSSYVVIARSVSGCERKRSKPGEIPRFAQGRNDYVGLLPLQLAQGRNDLIFTSYRLCFQDFRFWRVFICDFGEKEETLSIHLAVVQGGEGPKMLNGGRIFLQ